MLNKRHNSVITLSILLTLVGLSKPAKAFLLAQADTVRTTFTVPEELPKNTKMGIAASNSTSIINQGLKDGFAAKYPNAKVNVETQSAEDALNTLLEGKTDLVSIGRNLTAAEKRKGLVTVPISREKIAIVVSKDNPYNGNLTFAQFAKIFRGEITDWSEIGGQPGAIQLVDLPESNDTRQAFPNYSVFQEGQFTTGSNTTKVDEDSTDAMVSQLGANGIGYAVAGDVIDRDDVKVVTMHQTLPDDPRYPFSQPFSLVYQGTPSEAASAFLGFATTEAGQKTLAQRVGSLSVVGANGIVTGAKDEVSADADKAAQDGADTGDTDKVAQGDADNNGKLNPDVEGSGDPNVDVEDSGKINADLDDSGEIDANLDGSGDLNVDKVEGSGEVNPELEGSGEVNPELEGSGTPNTNANLGVNGNADGKPNSEINADIDTTPDAKTNVDGDKGVPVAAQKKWWWWLPLIIGIPLLGALAYKFIGGRGKSDQEPAISSISNPDSLQGDIDSFDPDIDGGDTKVGAGIGNVATETVNTGSKLGGAAIATGGAALAGGAAAINKVSGINKNKKDVDVDPDVELEDFVAQPETDIDASINEIPSNPVSEFTGQETTFQSTEQSTKLQVDDFESEDAGLVDDISAIGGVAAAGGAASTVFLNNKDTVDDKSDTFKIDSEASTQSGFVSEQSTTLPSNNVEEQIYSEVTTSSDEDLDNIESDASLTSREFEGDFVLDEEGQNTELDDTNSATDENSQIDDINVNETETTSSAQAFVIEKPEVESSDISDSVADQALGVVNDTTQTGGAAIAGGAAAIGGAAAAASGFFTNDNQDQTTEIDEVEHNETNIETNFIEDIDNSGTTSSAQAFVLETPEVTSTDNQDTVIEEKSGFADDTTQIRNDLGGSNPTSSGFFADGDVGNQTTEIDTDNINISDTNWVDETDSNQTTSSAQAFVLETPEVTSTDNQDTVIDQASGLVDNATQTGGAAIAGGAAAIGGAAAAASGFFTNRDRDSEQTTEVDRVDDVNWVDDVNLDFNNESESLVSNSEDNVEKISNSADISLEEITFDDDDSSAEDTLENITFDETSNSSTLSLDEITFDDDDSSTEDTLENITFDETINSSTISLDEITFDDSDDSSSVNSLIDNVDVDTSGEQNINIDDLGFTTQSTDVSGLINDQTTEIGNTPSNKSSDMNNISEWLDSIETPNKNTENISEWLDNLSAERGDITSQNTSTDNINNSESDSEDISFQFLEDLLERDTNKDEQ